LQEQPGHTGDFSNADILGLLRSDLGKRFVFQVWPTVPAFQNRRELDVAKAGRLTTGVACTMTVFMASTTLRAGPALAGQDDPTLLVLHVDNYARLPREALRHAEDEAGAIFAAAGIRPVWIHEDEPDTHGTEHARHLRVLLLCPVMTKQKVLSDRVERDVLGQAGNGSGRAYVFTQRIINAALEKGRRFEIALGRVIAHEVGHLVLPPGHAASGIMRRSPDLWKPHADRFSTSEGRQMQVALR
jgi:hypothetical protein